MKKYLARNHKFYIHDSGSWLQISGVSSWTVSYQSESSELAKFSNLGWGGSIITGRSGVITLNGFYLSDSSTGSRDAGQAACDAAAKNLGYHGVRNFKIEAFDDNQTPIGYILASGVFTLSALGGSVTAVNPWGVQVSLKGIPTGSGIYNIFSQETYPPPAPDISRSGMWTGVLGMYTYAE